APRGEAWVDPPAGRLFRIVSEPLEGKGRQRFMGCGPEGRVGLALQEKHRTAANEVFFSLRRGEVVAVEGTESRGDGVALVEGSSVRKVASAGQPFPSGREGGARRRGGPPRWKEFVEGLSSRGAPKVFDTFDPWAAPSK